MKVDVKGILRKVAKKSSLRPEKLKFKQEGKKAMQDALESFEATIARTNGKKPLTEGGS